MPELRHLQVVLDRLAPEPTRAANLRWSSVFRISHRIVSDYGRDRVFLAGDAAHIHPPTGAQGMNTGIQDAVALAWRLALAVRGRAATGLLASYDAERRPVGEEVVGRAVRHARAGYAGDDPATVQLREAQLLVAYPDSPVVGAGAGTFPGGPRPGERAPDCGGLRRTGVAFEVRLHELLTGDRFALLLYADDAGQLPALTGALPDLPGLLDVVLVLGPAATLPTAVTDRPFAETPAAVLRDTAGEFAAAYGAVGACCYLVRPDQHVSFRAARASAEQLATHLSLLIAHPVPAGHRS